MPDLFSTSKTGKRLKGKGQRGKRKGERDGRNGELVPFVTVLATTVLLEISFSKYDIIQRPLDLKDHSMFFSLSLDLHSW